MSGDRETATWDTELALLSERRNLPDSLVIAGKRYTVSGNSPLGEGLSARVWKAFDEYERPRAIKMCSPKFYADADPQTIMKEVRRASLLEGCEYIARFVDVDVLDIELADGHVIRVICFVEAFVEGCTLSEFIRERPDMISPSLIVSFVSHLAIALKAFHHCNLVHADLHLGNIMVATPSLGAITEEHRFVVIDTGQTRSSESVGRDDHDSFSKAVLDIWNALNRRNNLSLRDLLFLDITKSYIERMYDDDPTVALRSPSEIQRQFAAALDQASSPPRDQAPRLNSPFDFVSADHISDDRLLVSIFARSCPWLKKVSGPDPCLVTGPRGCGKSMIFRWLSLKAHLHESFDRLLEDVAFAGFYVSCSTDLQNRLAWIKSDEDISHVEELVVDYFNLLVAREVLRTLRTVHGRLDHETSFGLTGSSQRQILGFVRQALNPEASILLGGQSPIDQSLELVEYWLFQTQRHLRPGSPKRGITSRSFLGDFTTTLVQSCTIFTKLPIAFLVDDFSLHRISAPVQRILNTIIWERRPTHIFKLSSEKRGLILHDELLASSELSRERLEIDCGREYIEASRSGGGSLVDFTRELLDARLKLAGFAATADILIGKSSHPEGSLAKSIISKSGGPHPDHYHGLKCLSDLCTGDVSSLLYVLGAIFDQAAVSKTHCATIPAAVQHRAIVAASRQFVEAIGAYVPFGAEMSNVLNQFGNLMNRVLMEGGRQRGGAPTQIPRIEIDFDNNLHPLETLSEHSRSLATELVRRAIFIELAPGRSRHENVLTLRWHLRRIYLPAFGVALTKNDAVKRGPRWLDRFLADPALACNEVWSKWPRDQSAVQQDQTLFDVE